MAQFWDGRAKDLAEQAKGPVQASVEMNNTPENVIKVLNSMAEYKTRFKEAFPAEKDPVTFDNMVKAIEAFEAICSPRTPLRGEEDALDGMATDGLKITDIIVSRSQAKSRPGCDCTPCLNRRPDLQPLAETV